MIKENAQDAFIKGSGAIRMRISTELKVIKEKGPGSGEMKELVSLLTCARDKELLEKERNCEFAINYQGRWRFRVVVFYQKDEPVMVIRKIDLETLDFTDLNLPARVLENFCRERRGLILVTGMTGSGKSTTIAAMLEYINRNYGKHILTMEEPVEFTFEEKKAIINQRDLGKDVMFYGDALRQSVIHSPDVIFISNIRDRDTCWAALTAAETGVLVVSTIHSVNVVSTVERIVNFFPLQEQHLILMQLSFLLKGVLSLRLIPRADTKGLIPAYEAMTLSPTISSLLRENKIWEIPKCVADSHIFDMKSFNQCLLGLIKEKKISVETAMEYSDEKKDLKLMLDRG